MPNPRPLRVFLCHAKEDKPVVRVLYRQLTAEGWLDVWLDAEKLLPGQEWDIEIEKAAEQADVVVVCLSSRSVDKEGYVQKEIRFVLNIADEKPEGTIFVVPLRLDDCLVPRRLRAWQYVDYFPKGNRKWAYQRLLESLKLRANKPDISISKPVPVTPVIPNEDEFVKAERERITAQKAENERIAREKAEKERKAKEERDRLAAQKAEERRKARAEAWRKINFKPFLTIGGILIALLFLFMGGSYVINNLPVTSTQIILTSTKPGTLTETAVTVPIKTATNISTKTATSLLPTTLPTLQDGADLISFDTKMTGGWHKTFGFYGSKGQVVTITVRFLQFYYLSREYVLILKNLNGKELVKNYLVPSMTDYRSQIEFQQSPIMTIRDFTLPDTSTYYITVRSPGNWELNLTLVTP